MGLFSKEHLLMTKESVQVYCIILAKKIDSKDILETETKVEKEYIIMKVENMNMPNTTKERNMAKVMNLLMKKQLL